MAIDSLPGLDRHKEKARSEDEPFSFARGPNPDGATYLLACTFARFVFAGSASAENVAPDPHVMTRPGLTLLSLQLQPAGSLVHYRFVHLLLRRGRAFWNLERMVAAFNLVQRCRQTELLDHRAQFIWCTESVA
jgi:hypothetical protein